MQKTRKTHVWEQKLKRNNWHSFRDSKHKVSKLIQQNVWTYNNEKQNNFPENMKGFKYDLV